MYFVSQVIKEITPIKYQAVHLHFWYEEGLHKKVVSKRKTWKREYFWWQIMIGIPTIKIYSVGKDSTKSLSSIYGRISYKLKSFDILRLCLPSKI